MNGTESMKNPKIFHTPREQLEVKSKRERYRLFLAVLSTNIFVFLSCLLYFSPDQELGGELQPREGHTLLSVPLKSFVPYSSGPQKISLFNSEGELIMLRAYIVEYGSSLSLDGGLHHILEVPHDELYKLIPYQNETLTAHPFSLDHQQLKKSTAKKQERVNYEYIF